MANDSQLSIPSKNVNEFVPTLKIVIREGLEVDIPLTAGDNLLLSQVRVAAMRKKFDVEFDRLKSKAKAADLKSMVDSFVKLEEEARFAYAQGLNEAEGGTAAGKAAAEVAKAMAEGFATAGHKAIAEAKEDKMKKILELGKPKKTKIAEIISIDEEAC